MKKYIILHINDGKPKVMQNENCLFIERFNRTEEIIEQHLSQGYGVKQIISDYSPAKQGDGHFTFYKGGIIIYLEKDID